MTWGEQMSYFIWAAAIKQVTYTQDIYFLWFQRLEDQAQSSSSLVTGKGLLPGSLFSHCVLTRHRVRRMLWWAFFFFNWIIVDIQCAVLGSGVKPSESIIRIHTIVVQWKSLSRAQLFATPWTVARQTPLSRKFSRQECRSALPFPSPEDLSNPGIKSRPPALQADSLLSEPLGK